MKMKKEKIRFKPLAAVVFVVILAVVMLASALISAKAAPLTWQDICNRGESDLTSVAAYDLKAGCMQYGWNQTLDAGPDGNIYTGTNHHYDNVVGDELSRVMYAHKLRVADGMTVSIVAAQNDTEDEGGLTYIKGNNSGNNLYFYWSMGEYDADGNVVFDGDWRGVNESWTVGQELNHSSYGASGYPSGISQSDRESRVAYVMPVFRWAKGSLAVGGGSEHTFRPDNLQNSFEIIQLVTKPFTYTFYTDGGAFSDGGGVKSMERLGINNVSVPATPTRPGYVFTGWKITSAGGKQAGKVYDAGQLATMLSDSKYYSSLFANATFEAQWSHADQFVSYMGNGADNTGDYVISYNAAQGIDNKYSAFNFKKTGYSGSGNWIQKDQFMNTTGTVSGSGRESMPQLSGLTSIRTKCGGRYKCVDINAASIDNGANVQIWDCINGNAQMFAFEYVKTENNVPYWTIRNNYSGKVLDVDGTAAGANVQQYAYHGGDNQLWTLKMAGDGYFYICSKLGNCTSLDSSSLVLDLWGYSTDNGTNITISGYHGGDNQQWYLWDNTINLSVEWTNNNYKVDYNANGGTLLDENGNATTDTVRTYEYDKIYSFLKAERAYTVSYETNGGTASIMDTNTNAAATFNGWNEQLTEQTSHGEVNGWDGWSVGTWNWAAYYNGNPDLLRATNNTYDTMWAILHYREHGIDEGRTFNGASYWLPALSFKNLTANGGTVNVKADYTNGSVTLPKAEKASVEIDGKTISYTFDGWYLDAALTNRVGGAGDTYTPAGNTKLYAKYTTDSIENNYTVTVEHFLMDTDGKYPATPHESTTKQYKSGAEINVTDVLNDYEGYEYDSEKTKTANGQLPATVTQDITLQVYYMRNRYTVTYNVSENGGNWSDGSTKPVTKDYYWGQSVDLSPAAQKTEYDFLGWNTDSSKTEAIKSLVMPQEDVTLYALYSGDLTAKFVDSYGVRTVTGTRYNNTKDVVITVPDIRDYAWDGVTSTSVIGWNSNTDINAAEAKENEITTDTITISSNVIFYAVYAAEVTLEYNLNGADESQMPAPVTVTAYTNAYDLTNVCGEKVTLAQAVKHTLEAQEGYIDSYVQTAWAENSLDGKQYATGSEYNLTQNTVMYAIWDGEIKPITYTIHFDGNGSTSGKIQDINVKYDEQVTLPDNAFVRTTDWGDSTFMGWNRTADTKTIEFSNQDIVSNLSSTDGDVVVLYAIWDDCPEITAKDRYFTLQEAQNGLITEEKLLETASADDDIDTDINDKIYVKYYSENEWKQFTTKGSSLIKYEVIDSSGNVSNCTATVYIVDTTAQEVDDKRYARFINERYYNKSFEEGGLEDNSIWKLPEYAEVLEDAMQNRISLTEEQKTIQILGNTYTAVSYTHLTLPTIA